MRNDLTDLSCVMGSNQENDYTDKRGNLFVCTAIAISSEFRKYM